jgi:hypothetical protein
MRVVGLPSIAKVDDDIFSVAGIAKVGDGNDFASCGGNDRVTQIVRAIEVDCVWWVVIGSRRSGPYLATSEKAFGKQVLPAVRCQVQGKIITFP